MHTNFRVWLLFIAPLALFPSAVRAETAVGGPIVGDAIWDQSGSPYLLQSDVTVPRGSSLTIGPHTSVSIATSTDIDPASPPALYVSGGRLRIAGAPADRAHIEKIGGVFIGSAPGGRGSADIGYADFDGAGVGFDGATGAIASSSFSGAPTAIHVAGSDVSVRAASFSRNDIGIYVEPHEISQIGERMAPARSGTGGYGNALALGYASSSDVSVTGSSFSGNISAAIYNFDDSTVDARHDWWGSAAGPSSSGADSVKGRIAYEPWLLREPDLADAPAPPVRCCSSVLFIPGIEGSRLFHGTNQLWEPNRNLDAKRLVLDAKGSSTMAGIYSGGPIDRALGLKDVYGRFMAFMDGLVATGTMAEWQPFGYDWRKGIDEIVAGPERKATTTVSLEAAVESLAARSRTGKATIVAHSMGGLVAKGLVKRLEAAGKAALVDKVITVGAPFYGTPQAVAALLHGDGTSLAHGLLLRAATGRSLSANMPSAYALLPSAPLFDRIRVPTIAFAPSTIRGLNDGSYPPWISSAFEEGRFLADDAGARRAPDAADTSLPIRANRLLLAGAQALHAVLDPYRWPATIAAWAIAGWNKATLAGIVYRNDGSKLAREATTTMAGDGTVLARSALSGNARYVSIDLGATGGEHSDIMESSTTERAIEAMIEAPGAGDAEAARRIASIPNVTLGEPDYDAEPAMVEISTHSPVDLDVYDSEGRHTGTVPVPAELAQNDALAAMYEEDIPGSSYRQYGDGPDHETYIHVPGGAGKAYSVAVSGLGFGPFEVDIRRFDNGASVSSTTFTGIATPLMAATTSIAGSEPSDASASRTPSLHIDIDGDGAPDIDATPSAARPSEADIRAAFRRIIFAVFANDGRRAPLMAFLERWKPRQDGRGGDGAHASFIGHMELRGMSSADRGRLAESILRELR